MVMYFWERSASVWLALLYVLLGGLLLAFPAATSTAFVWALAGGAACYGVSRLLRYLQTRKNGTASGADLFLTVLPVAFAVFALVWPQTLLAFLPLVLGALLLLDGLGKLPLAIDALRYQQQARVPLAVSSFLPLALGLLILVRPFQTAQLVIRVFGIALLLDGVSDLAACLTERRSR